MAYHVTGTGPATWGSNVTAFMAHFSAWKIDSDGLRYSAQRKTDRGPRGRKLTAATLDELGGKIDAAEAESKP